MLFAGAVAVLLTACADHTGPTELSGLAPSNARASRSVATSAQQPIQMTDECDPATFNAAVGPGTCNRAKAGVTFQRFIGQLQQNGFAFGWHFTPTVANIQLGATLVASNVGGETHTFTEVAHFGGGINATLNQLSGNPTPAPECLALKPEDFVAPGGTFNDTPDETGTELYQCCIHPWMRTTVHIHAK
jgi:hypothetical protein